MTTTTTNRLRDLIFAGDLIERKCWNCKTQFHEGDYKTDNGRLQHRHLDNVDWEEFPPKTSQGGIKVKIALEHKACPARVLPPDKDGQSEITKQKLTFK